MPLHGPNLTGISNVSLASGAKIQTDSGQSIVENGQIVGELSQNIIGSDKIDDGTIVNADVAPLAGIELSKLQLVTVTQVPVGSEGGTLVARTLSGDVKISDQGVTSIQQNAVTAFHIGATLTIPVTDNTGTPVGVAVYYDPATGTLNANGASLPITVSKA